jgi:hypothetical protein
MSWDRSRSIPWSKITQDGGVDPYEHKEQVLREMQQESQQQEAQQTSVDGDEVVVKRRVEFSGIDLLKQAAFGGCIGA